MAGILEKAQRLYDEGKWHEAVTLLNKMILDSDFSEIEEIAETYRLKGWCFYYIGTKGPEEGKM